MKLEVKLVFIFQELLARVTQLEAHVKQLKHLLLKAKGENDKGAKKYGKQRPFDFTRYEKENIVPFGALHMCYTNTGLPQNIVMCFFMTSDWHP